MNPGYYLEEELILEDSSYTSYYGHVPGYGLLKNEYEGEPEEPVFQEWEFEQKKEDDEEAAEKDILTPERRRYICNTLKQAVVGKLKDAITDYARHECTGCRIDHPSQKYHDLCLWTSPADWIVDYGYDEAALSCLDIYKIIKEWDSLLWLNKTRGLRDFVTKRSGGSLEKLDVSQKQSKQLQK